MKTFNLNKLSQSKETKAINAIFNAVEKIPGMQRNKTYKITGDSAEMMFEDLMGTCYIQVFYDEWHGKHQPAFKVQRYYENEFVDQEYQKTIPIPVDFGNPNETFDQIKHIIDIWLGTKQKTKSPKIPESQPSPEPPEPQNPFYK